jgi:TolA-binding protein
MQRDTHMRYDPLPDSVYFAPTQASSTARPFTPQQSVFLFVGALLLIALTYVVVELVFRGDWSDGARAAGIVALSLAAVTVIVAITRFARGRRSPMMVILSFGMLAILLATGIASLSQINSLHLAQAHSFERSGEYGGAIQEYALYGESAPKSVDIARTYLEWGNSYLKQRQYRDAAARFAIVVSQYDKSGQSYIQARQKLFETYATWLKTGQPIPYANAINALASYRTDPACDPACQSDVGAVEAQARYLYGAQLAAAHQYTAAITQFNSVQQLFPKSPYATKSYQGAAQAYWAVGQSQLTTSCPSAVPTYQTLVKSYGDTDEGKKAKSALGAPQTVTGVVTHAPGNPLPTIYLAKKLNPSASNFSFSKDYTTKLDAKTGKFTFKNVKPGTYYFVTARDLGTQIEYTYLKYSDGGKPAPVTVGPLCPLDIGAYHY